MNTSFVFFPETFKTREMAPVVGRRIFPVFAGQKTGFFIPPAFARIIAGAKNQRIMIMGMMVNASRLAVSNMRLLVCIRCTC